MTDEIRERAERAAKDAIVKLQNFIPPEYRASAEDAVAFLIDSCFREPWSDEPPTDPGWYWFRKFLNAEPRLVRVAGFKHNKKKLGFEDWSVNLWKKLYPNCQWQRVLRPGG